MKPKEAVIAVTYRCNARCRMCNIWKASDVAEIDPKHYAKLPESLRSINITGGEPFLRGDLVEVVRVIHARAPSARIVFSTNGSKKDLIVETMNEIRAFHSRIGVGVSIDGMNELHDLNRGVSGLFGSAVSTLKTLKKMGFDDLRIGMTITAENLKDVEAVFKLSEQIGVEFSATFAHNSEIYFKKTDNTALDFSSLDPETVYRVMRSQLRSGSVKDWFRAYHMQGVLDPRLRKEFLTHCEAGKRYFFVAPNGDVFPCQVMNLRIGNLAEVDRWEEILTPEAAARVDKRVRGCKEDCWMVCNTRSLIRSHPFKAGFWVARNKLRAQFDSSG